MLRLIREEEPPKPSTRLTSSPGAARDRRGAAQERRRRSCRGAVRGELDWIVMKALEKDRNRRYETANGLALDVERYLNDEPVHACPPTLGYRFRKYARKNKVALATGSAIAAALVVGIALTSWQAVRATHAEHATAAERDKTADERDAACRLGEKLDARLVEIKAANEKIQPRPGPAARRPVRLGHADSCPSPGMPAASPRRGACSNGRIRICAASNGAIGPARCTPNWPASACRVCRKVERCWESEEAQSA